MVADDASDSAHDVSRVAECESTSDQILDRHHIFLFLSSSQPPRPCLPLLSNCLQDGPQNGQFPSNFLIACPIDCQETGIKTPNAGSSSVSTISVQLTASIQRIDLGFTRNRNGQNPMGATIP